MIKIKREIVAILIALVVIIGLLTVNVHSEEAYKPIIQSVTVSPTEIVNGGEVTLTVIAKSNAPVNWLSRSLDGPNGNIYGGGSGVTFTNVGDDLWKYERTHTISEWDPSGTYTYSRISVENEGQLTSDEWEPVSFNVSNDHVAYKPIIQSVTVSPTEIVNGGEVTLTVIAKSNAPVNWLSRSLDGPNGNIYGGGSGVTFINVGDDLWKYERPYTVSEWDPSGTYTWSHISVENEGQLTSDEWGPISFNVTRTTPPEITYFAPRSPVNDTVDAWRTFNVTVNQTVNVSWYLNNTLQHTNVSKKEANYTLHAEVVGEHNVSAIASNENGTDMQTWVWNVTVAPEPVLEINKTGVPDPVSPGGALDYTIRVNNAGNATAINVIVKETYEANVTFIAAAPAPSSGDDTWQFATLNASETRWINISVTVNASVLNGTVLHNIVNVTCDEGVTDSDTADTTVLFKELNCTCGDICVNTTGWWRDGGAFNTSGTPIEATIDNATAGDVICVKDGTYTENVDVNKRLTIRSENGAASTSVRAARDGYVFEVTADYVNISGFHVTSATRVTSGIYLYGANYCNISDNIANDNFYHGIFLNSSSNNTLTNNNANSNNESGIYLYLDSNNNNLINNIVSDNKGDGFKLESNSNHNRISGNNASNNDNNGIHLYGTTGNPSSHNIVANNTADLNDKSGIMIEGADSNHNTIVNNTCKSNVYGMSIRYGDYNNLTKNTCNQNTVYGIRLYQFADNNEITNNTAISNTEYGIYISSSDNIIYNNYFNNTNNACDNSDNVWNTTKTLGTNIIGGPYLGGNYWSDYAGRDINGDGLGDTLLPYNSSGNITNDGDYHPLVPVGYAPVLSIVKLDNPDPVSPGGTLNYSICVKNTGNATATNVTVMETYDKNVTFVAAVPKPSSGNDTWQFPTLNVSEMRWINVSAIVNASVLNRAVLHNIVNVSCAEGVTDSDTADTTVLFKELNCTCGDICVITTGWWRDGGAFNTSGTPIQAAIDNATAGDVICVKDGTYTENVDVHKRLTIRSENGAASTSVQAARDGYVFEVTADYVNISGFYVTSATKLTSGIYLYGANYCNISDNIANDNSYHGIFLNSSSNNTLVNNNANSNNESGIYLYLDSNNNNLINNTASENKGDGFKLESNSNRNRISGNNASDNDNNGIRLYGTTGNPSSHNIVANNTADLNDKSGIMIEGADSNHNTIVNNTCKSNVYGMSIRYGDYNNLTKNTCNQNTEYGIRLYQFADNNEITNNKAISNTEYGIYISSSDNIIYNNYFNNTNNACDNSDNVWNTTKTLGTNIIGGPYLGGNYWSDYAGRDINGDGLGDTLLPYNSSGDITNDGDYHPLVPVGYAPVLSIEKSDNPDPVSPGGTLNYSIHVNNTGNATATNVNVTETYDANVTFVTAVPAPSSGDDTWQFPTLNVSETRWINVFVIVNASVLNRTVLHNIVNVSCAEGVTGSGTENTTVFVAPALPPNITSFAPPSPVNDTVCNWRTFNVTVDQTVNVSWYLNNTLQHTNVSTKEANYTLHAEVVGEHNVTAIASNENGTDMQTWVWNVTVAPEPVLEINKTGVPDPVSPGGALNYTIRVNNAGNATAINVIVKETYEANVTFIAAAPAPSSGDDTWQFATLNASETRWINVSVIVNASVLNEIVLHNSVNVSCDEGVTDSDTADTTVLFKELNCTCGDICVITTGWWRDGGAFNTSGTPIQAAIDNATAGDTICVKDGTYTENVDVNKRLTIRSENGAASTSVRAARDGYVFEVTADYVNISGFHVTGATKLTSGIYLYGANYCNISDNIANDNSYHGIFLNSSSDNTLGNNNANSNNESGIYLYLDSNNNYLINNTASENKGDGFKLESNSNHNSIIGNNASDNDKNGIRLYGTTGNPSSHNTVANNTADLNAKSGIIIEGADSDYNTIVNNTCKSNDYGIYVKYGDYNNLTKNMCNQNSEYGIRLYRSADDNEITNNTAISNTEYGIYISSSNYNIIYNNYFNNTNNACDNRDNVWNTTKTLGTNIIGGPYLGGNYWSDYAGRDINGDGLGDTLLPYNSSGDITNDGDYHPLVPVGYGPVLSIKKSDNPDPVSPAGTLNYSIRVNNTGYANATNVTVMETYDKNVTFVAAVPTPSSGNDTWQFPTLNVIETRWINVSVIVNASVLNRTVLHNSVNVSCDEGFTDSDTADTTVSAGYAPPEITYFAPPSPVNDTVDALRTFNVTVNQTVDVEWYLDALPQQTNESVKVASFKRKAEEGEHIVTATASNVNGSDSHSWIWNVKSISVTKLGNVSAAAPSSLVNFNITVSNIGDSNLTQVVVNDTLPQGMTYKSSYPRADSTNGTITWNITGSLAVGDYKEITLVAEIEEDAEEGVLTNTVDVTGTTENGTDVSASATAEVRVIRLEIEKSCSSTTSLGKTVKYTIKYSNGEVDLTNVVITEDYPDSLTFISADPAPDSGTNNKWTIGTLPAGESGKITIKMKVPASMSDLSYTESGSVSGEGIVMISKELSTKVEPFDLENIVTISGSYKETNVSATASAITTVSVSGSSLELTEHGSGIYESEEELSVSPEKMGIKFDKTTNAEYSPTTFNCSDGFVMEVPSKWSQDICIKNYVKKSAIHKTITEATYMNDNTIIESDNKGYSMDFDSSFLGYLHVGKKTNYAATSEHYIGEFEIKNWDQSGKEIVDGVGYVIVDKELYSGKLLLMEHGSGIYSSEDDSSSSRIKKTMYAVYEPTYFNFSDGFVVNFSSKWMQDVCAKSSTTVSKKKRGNPTLLHKKIRDATYIDDETIATSRSLKFDTYFYGATHIGLRSRYSRASEDYIGDFYISWGAKTDCTFIFDWDDVPGPDNDKLIMHLSEPRFGMPWVTDDEVEITKPVNDTIDISTPGHSAGIILNTKTNKTAELIVDGFDSYTFVVRKDDHTLKVFDCELERKPELVSGEGFVMVDEAIFKDGEIEVTEHGSGTYYSEEGFGSETKIIEKETYGDYMPTYFSFSDSFSVNFSSMWMHEICAKDEDEGTALHKKISDAALMKDDTTAAKSLMNITSSFNGSMHIGARTENVSISEDYIGEFNVTQLIKIVKEKPPKSSSKSSDWLFCPCPIPSSTYPWFCGDPTYGGSWLSVCPYPYKDHWLYIHP